MAIALTHWSGSPGDPDTGFGIVKRKEFIRPAVGFDTSSEDYDE
jgi:hypothetical protein